jgi:hypothetical protein
VTAADISFVIEPRAPAEPAGEAHDRAWSWQDPFLGRLGITTAGQRLHIAQEGGSDAAYGQYLYANLLALADVLAAWPAKGDAVPMVDEPVTLLLEAAGEGCLSLCFEALGARGPGAIAGLADSRCALAGALRDYIAWLDPHLEHHPQRQLALDALAHQALVLERTST